ncbi:hypothetical protein BKI52_10935 [marine bacterium AO1-C]|nr:hypothetical protein BKI52_10935 [marine bacterium AO1-C]
MKKMIMKQGWVRLLFIFILSLSLNSCNINHLVQTPFATKGLLNLQSWDFEKNGSVVLNGHWEFYWQNHLDPKDFVFPENLPEKRMVQVPGNWTNSNKANDTISSLGYGTYRLKITLPKIVPDKLGLKLPSLRTSGRVFINGRQVVQLGKPGTTKLATTPQYLPQIIEISPDWSELELIVQVSNFHYRKGGILRPISLGGWQHVTQNRLRKMLMTMFLIGIMLFAGLYYLGLFGLRRRSKEVLYFALFCLLVSIRDMSIGERIVLEIVQLPWALILKMEYLGFYASIGLFALFCKEIFPNEFSSILVKIYVWIAGISSLMVIASPPLWFSYLLEVVQLISILGGLYATYAIIRANVHKRDGAQIFLVGWILFFASVINDILFANTVIATGHMADLGFTTFILSQSYLLTVRFSRAFKQTEDLSAKLDATNKNLEKIVAEKTDSLMLANQRLSQRQKAMRDSLEEIRNINDKLTENSLELRGQISAINRTLGFVEISPNGKILEVNSIFSYVTGYEREALIGRDHLTLLNQSELDKETYDKFWRDLSRGIPASGESKFIAQNDTELWFSTSYTPIIDQQGQINKIILLTNDITAQKLQNLEFEAQYNAVNQLNAALEIDLEGNVLRANELFLNLIGYSLSEIEGTSLLELLDKALYTNAKFQEFWQHLLDNESMPGEFLFETKAGGRVWIAGAYNIVRDLNGHPKKVLTLSHDITKAKQTAQENKKLALATSKTNNAVIITDAQGRVEWLNEGFTKISGYTLDDLKGKNPGELLNGPETDTDTVNLIREKIKNGEGGIVDVLGYKKNGGTYWVNLSFTPIFNEQGVLTNYINVETDITSQKEAEEAIKLAKERTEKVFELTSDFSGSLDEQLQRVLEYATRYLKMENGVISEIKGDKYVVYEIFSKEELVPKGQVIPLEQTYCSVTLTQATILAFDSKESAPDKEHPCFDNIELSAYIGVPIRIEGKVFGTLNFSSGQPLGRKLMQGDKDFVLLLAEWVGSVISRLRHEHKLKIMKEEVEIMNTILNEQNALLNSKNDQLEGQSAAIKDQYHVIKDSIEYAQRIQNAILPPIEKIQQALPESFVFYQPRDLVSGDLYWFAEKKELGQDKVIIAVLDCTGHGVPGAFMSMIGNDLLNQVVHDKEIHSPEVILQELHRLIRQVLRQDELDNNDGMDMGILTINKKDKTIDFAGAKHSLMLIQDGEMQIIKGDRMPLGGEQIEKQRVFKNYRFAMPEVSGTLRLYMASDGYQDQFGGERGRKFMTLRFRELLQNIHHHPMAKQKEILETTLSDWMQYPGVEKNKYDQIDDILVLGICL